MCKGTVAAHQEALKSAERNKSHDPTARTRGDDKEEDRIINAAAKLLRDKFSDNQETATEKGSAYRRQSSSDQKGNKGYRTRASESPPPRTSTNKERRSYSPPSETKKCPKTSEVYLGSLDSSQEGRKGRKLTPNEHQTQRPVSRPPRSASPAIYKNMEK